MCLCVSPVTAQPQSRAPVVAAPVDEVDPLEAFMAEIDTVVVQQTAAATEKASEIERVGDVDNADKV